MCMCTTAASQRLLRDAANVSTGRVLRRVSFFGVSARCGTIWLEQVIVTGSMWRPVVAPRAVVAEGHVRVVLFLAVFCSFMQA